VASSIRDRKDGKVIEADVVGRDAAGGAELSQFEEALDDRS
jgi:hypothetical protein